MKTETRGDQLSPWHDVSRMFNNALSLTVKVGDREYDGRMVISLDDHRHLTIEIPEKKAPRKKVVINAD